VTRPGCSLWLTLSLLFVKTMTPSGSPISPPASPASIVRSASEKAQLTPDCLAMRDGRQSGESAPAGGYRRLHLGISSARQQAFSRRRDPLKPIYQTRFSSARKPHTSSQAGFDWEHGAKQGTKCLSLVAGAEALLDVFRYERADLKGVSDSSQFDRAFAKALSTRRKNRPCARRSAGSRRATDRRAMLQRVAGGDRESEPPARKTARPRIQTNRSDIASERVCPLQRPIEFARAANIFTHNGAQKAQVGIVAYLRPGTACRRRTPCGDDAG
jgi:hypothetical protein